MCGIIIIIIVDNSLIRLFVIVGLVYPSGVFFVASVTEYKVSQLSPPCGESIAPLEM